MKKSTKIIVIISACILELCILLGITFFAIGGYFYNMALNRSGSFEHVSESDEEAPYYETKFDWFEAQAKEEISITSYDKLNLTAYKILNENTTNKWAIVIHGYRGQNTYMSAYAYHFYEMGYNVLLPSLRGHGTSEGDYIGMGYHDRLDILKWIDLLVKNDNDSKIVLFGVSMGAATTMMTTGETLPENVVCAVEDCGYSSVYDQFKYVLNHDLGLPDFPVMQAGNTMAKLKAGYTFKEASAVEQLKKSTTPTLFIHGDNDDFVPFEMLDKVYNSLKEGTYKEKLVVKGALHGQASSVASNEYERIDGIEDTINGEPLNEYWYRVKAFTDKFVK